jgi:hypothetical protein
VSVRSRLWSVPVLAAALLLATPAAAHAGGVVDPAPIGPNQAFLGQVNGVSTGATIKVGCFGPVFPGQTGHPLDNQTVSAAPLTGPTPLHAGFTGSLGTSIGVSFSPASTTASPVILRTWVVTAKIPTTLVLPCYGSGTVVFQPLPNSPTARAATVAVTYVGQP